jgi:predicted MPP superfamily phosphohydrolase
MSESMVLYGGLTSLLIVALILLLRTANQNTKKLRVAKVEIQLAETAAQVNPLRILQLTDMHMEHLPIRPEQIKQAIGEHSLDLIVLTGDFLDRRRSLPKLATYLEMLQTIPTTYGKFAVFGNHDYLLAKRDFQQLQQLLQSYGIRCLQNEHVSWQVNDHRVNLIGIDDFSTRRSDVVRSFAGVEHGTNIVITHDPNVVLKMKNHRFDYLMAGHFHGGQIHWPKPFHLVKMGKLARQKRVRGLHYEDGQAFYISEGIGQTGVNLRLGSLPELTIHHLHSGRC